jgi:hypothetical protein
MSEPTTTWYIIKTANSTCEIVTAADIPESFNKGDIWGPFPSKSDAIAKRVGLIRAGKCQPL